MLYELQAIVNPLHLHPRKFDPPYDDTDETATLTYHFELQDSLNRLLPGSDDVSKFKDEFYDTPTKILLSKNCWLRRRSKKNKVEWTLKEEIKNYQSLIVYRKIKDDSIILSKLHSLLNSPQSFEDPKKYCSECFASFETLRVGFLSSPVKWWIDSCQFKEGVYYLSGTLEVKWSIFQENTMNIGIILTEMAKNPASSKIVAHLRWLKGENNHIYYFDPLPLGISTIQHDNAQKVDPKNEATSSMFKQESPKENTQKEVIDAVLKYTFYDPSVPKDYWDDGEPFQVEERSLDEKYTPSWEKL